MLGFGITALATSMIFATDYQTHLRTWSPRVGGKTAISFARASGDQGQTMPSGVILWMD